MVNKEEENIVVNTDVDVTSENDKIDEAAEELADEFEGIEEADVLVDDDELFYAASDRITFKDDDTVMVEQDDNIVTWEISGLYNKNGKLHKKLTLLRKPPVFTISSSRGDIAEFVVTKEMSLQLYKTFEIIYKGYFGLDGRNANEEVFSVRVKNQFNNFVNWIKIHPVKFGLGLIVVVGFIVAIIFGFNY